MVQAVEWLNGLWLFSTIQRPAQHLRGKLRKIVQQNLLKIITKDAL